MGATVEVAQARWQDAAPGGTRLPLESDKSQAMCHPAGVNSRGPSSLSLRRAESKARVPGEFRAGDIPHSAWRARATRTVVSQSERRAPNDSRRVRAHVMS
jgi:hypothetical protein